MLGLWSSWQGNQWETREDAWIWWYQRCYVHRTIIKKAIGLDHRARNCVKETDCRGAVPKVVSSQISITMLQASTIIKFTNQEKSTFKAMVALNQRPEHDNCTDWP